jgi:protein O-GlcNAc transferase
MSGPPFDTRLAAIQGQMQKGDAAGARATATVLLAELPPASTQRAAALWARARAAEGLGDFAAGCDDLVAALVITPQETRMWDDLGILHMQAGRHADAAAAFAQSVARGPDNVRAWNNLGNAFVAQGKLQEALRPFREAVTRKPDYALAWANLGNTLRDDGQEREGEHALQRALALNPVQITALTALGSLRRQQGRIDEAVELYARAAKADSRNANACLQLAFALADRDDLEGARRVYGEAERRDPRLLRAAIGARLTLPVIADDAAAIARARTAFAAGIDELARIVPARIAGAPAERVLDGLRWSNFLLAYHGEDDLALQQRYAAFVGETLDRAAPALRVPLQRRPRAGKLRVGFVSSFFRDGTAGRYFERWITDLDRSRFEVAVYHLYPNTDHLTARLTAAADAFVHCPRWLPAQIAQRLRSDALDVIVYPELGMDATTFALAALRLAPLQCAGWGHPVTTGQPTIDVFLTSGAMEPEGAEAHYSERLVRLPGIGTRYAMPLAPPGATRAGCGLPDDGPLLLCPQALFKIHPDDDALFARDQCRR